jgi:hypothetical protein
MNTDPTTTAAPAAEAPPLRSVPTTNFAISERPVAERCCGVWVVNIQSGRVIAYVKFEDALQEIFAV